MIACFFNKDNHSTIHLEEVTRIELTERDKGNHELVYYIDLAYEPDARMMLFFEEWGLLWADKRR